MRVAIEALGIGQPGGSRSLALNMLSGLARYGQENSYCVFLSSPEPALDAFGNVEQRVLPLRRRAPSFLWAQACLPFALRRGNFHLVHHVKDLALLSPGVPSVVTAYDLTIPLLPELFSPLEVWYWRLVQPRLFRRSDRVLAISQQTRRDICCFFGVDERRVIVVYPSLSPIFRPLDEGVEEGLRARFGLERGYVLHVGSIWPKKNLELLVRAVKLLRERWDATVKLVLVGRVYRAGADQGLRHTIRELGAEGWVVFTGAVGEAELLLLYNGASALAFPSLHEGFGIAPAEAMACGTPTVVAAVPALCEAVGEAAVILEQGAEETLWAEALLATLRSGPLRRRLRDAGLERARRFTQEVQAAGVLAVYRGLAGR